MVGEHSGVTFLLLILSISVIGEVTGQQKSGEFQPTDNQTKSLRNVTKSLGYNNRPIVIECRSDSMNFTNQPSWFKYYDNGKIVIYNASTSSNSNSSKYLVDTGNKTLTVMNVQLSDAATYCCNVGDFVDYCSNVVVIGSVMPNVRPSKYLVEIGDGVNLTCSLIYNAPTSDRDSPFPLSVDQEPKLSLFIGNEEIFEAQVFVDVATVPHRKTMSINRTVEVADLDRHLECRLTSTEPYWYTITFGDIASLGINIIYPRRILQSGYYVNDVFQCISERFPFLEVTWTDVTTPNTPRNISTGIGNATAKVLATGNYVWSCSIQSPLKTTTISQKITFTARYPSEGNKGSTGVKVSLPVLFTAGCVLFIASIVFGV